MQKPNPLLGTSRANPEALDQPVQRYSVVPHHGTVSSSQVNKQCRKDSCTHQWQETFSQQVLNRQGDKIFGTNKIALN